MLMTWKAYYCQDGNAAQSDLQIPGKPVKIPMTFSGKREKNILKFTGNFRGCQIAKTTLQKKNIIDNFTLLISKLTMKL